MSLRSPILALLVVSALGAPAAGQLAPGQSLVAVRSNPSLGSMFVVDHASGTATQLTLPQQLIVDRPNALWMLDAANGFVGTCPPTDRAAVLYRIVISGTAVTATRLDTTQTAATNMAQLAVVGQDVWFTTVRTHTRGGVLQSVPIAGGPVTRHFDFATLPAFTGAANALAVIGTKVYVAGSSTSTNPADRGSLAVFDIATGSGSVVMQLPPSRMNSPAGYSIGATHMHEHPEHPGTLLVQGFRGDYVRIDPATATVVEHFYAGTVPSPFTPVNEVTSCAYDPRTRDWIVGTQDGAIERIVDRQSAEGVVQGIGTATNPLQNLVAGIWHVPATAGRDEPIGAGCVGNGDYWLTDASRGLPARGNASFAFAAHGGRAGDAAALLVGGAQQHVDLGVLGGPGCILRTDVIAAFPVLLSGSRAGNGTATIPLPVPAATPVGLSLLHQWVELQATPTNAAGLVVSNARRLTVE